MLFKAKVFTEPLVKRMLLGPILACKELTENMEQLELERIKSNYSIFLEKANKK